jgi:RNA processing factor Prp31
MYSADIKKCAKQIVREAFNQILAGTYTVPSLEEMETVLERNFDYAFDDYKAIQKIKRSHLDWNERQVADELERKRLHYENELRVGRRVAALNTIEEVENLIRSLSEALREWKVVNL